jgi:hypothetical protein
VEKQDRTAVDHNLVDVGGKNSFFHLTLSTLLDPQEQITAALNVEGDFEQVKTDSIAHPNVNGGDFLLAGKQDELVGCGAKNLGGTKPPSAVTTPAPSINKTEQVGQLLTLLNGLLSNSSADVLADLLASGNDTKRVVEKLQNVATTTQPSPITKSPEEIQKARQKIESEILKSLEELSEVESQEFVDMDNNTHELVALGSGMEPPPEKLITLTPVKLSAQQATTKPASTGIKSVAEAEGFDVNVMVG